jgi:hypothetical protein
METKQDTPDQFKGGQIRHIREFESKSGLVEHRKERWKIGRLSGIGNFGVQLIRKGKLMP